MVQAAPRLGRLCIVLPTSLLDEDPKIFVDPFARAFAGYASDAEMLQAIVSVEMIEFPRMRAVFNAAKSLCRR